MTGYGADGNQEHQDRVDAIVPKPFDIDQLRATLAALLRNQ